MHLLKSYVHKPLEKKRDKFCVIMSAGKVQIVGDQRVLSDRVDQMKQEVGAGRGGLYTVQSVHGGGANKCILFTFEAFFLQWNMCVCVCV